MKIDTCSKMPEPVAACMATERPVNGVVGDMLNSLRCQMAETDKVIHELRLRLQPVLMDIVIPGPREEPSPKCASPLFKELYDIATWAVMKHKELTLILERMEI